MKRLPLASLLVVTAALIGLAEQRQQTLRVDVDRVQVYATVTDPSGHYVVSLGPENFEIYEDRVRQKIESFSSEDVPLSVGILLDVSGSIQNSLTLEKDAAVAFLKSGNPEDEYFLVEFSDRAHLSQDFTTDVSKLQNHIAFTPSNGNTALLDAMYLGLATVRKG